MSRASEAANSVVKACIEACDLYRVPVLRMQSRAITMTDKRGAPHAYFMGRWRDDAGGQHTAGMADLLAMPRITLMYPSDVNGGVAISRITVPLWVECKYGAGRMDAEQVAFKQWVEAHGAYYVEARDCADAVLEWFHKMGVRR